MPDALVTNEKPSVKPTKAQVMDALKGQVEAVAKMPNVEGASVTLTPPVGGWAGDTQPSIERARVVETPEVEVLPPPAGVVPFLEFALRYFTGNMIRDEAYRNPKAIRSIAADCATAYHAYIYAVSLGMGVTNRSPEGQRYGGMAAIHADIRGAVAKMDKEMDGR